MCLIVSAYLQLKIEYDMGVIYFFYDKNPIETILLPRNTGLICFNWSHDKIVQITTRKKDDVFILFRLKALKEKFKTKLILCACVCVYLSVVYTHTLFLQRVFNGSNTIWVKLQAIWLVLCGFRDF